MKFVRIARAAQFSRLLSSCNFSRNVDPVMLNVEKYGTLEVDTKSSVDIDMIDCQKYPDQNVAFADFGGCDGTIKWDPLKKLLKLTDSNLEDLQLRIEIPVKFNILARVENKGISIRNLQNEFIRMTINNGKCSMKNLLTDSIFMSSKNGDILCDGFVQSNADFALSDVGNICIKKIIGESLKVKATRGDVNISSLYVENSVIETDYGNITLDNVHKTSDIKIYEKGNVKIGSLDGITKIYVNEGKVELFAYKHKDVSVYVSEGEVKVLLPEGCKSKLNIEAKEIDVCEEFDLFVTEGSLKSGTLKGSLSVSSTEDMPVINVTCKNGKVQVGKQDWLNAFFKK